jgi:hypothetical protein
MTGIVGVRFERAGRVHFYAAADTLAVGDWVAIETAEGTRTGWVVIAPHQVVLDELPERPTAVARRGARPPSAVGNETGKQAAGRFGLAAGLIGPAHAPSLPPDLDAAAGLVARLAAGLGPRNRDYLARKLRLPTLGQVVETPHGPGRVVAVQVLRERVTVALAGGGEIVLGGPGLEPVPAEEEEPARGERRSRRGRRRERRAAWEGEVDATPG